MRILSSLGDKDSRRGLLVMWYETMLLSEKLMFCHIIARCYIQEEHDMKTKCVYLTKLRD
jgi:hypothetical protein